MPYNAAMDTDQPHPDAEGTAGPPPVVVKALRRLLRPLVGLLIRQGVTFPFLAALLKEVFVEVAETGFPVKGKDQTDSRISLLSGIHRKDVKRIRLMEGRDQGPPPKVSIGAQMIALWTADPAYLDKAGRPLPLPRLARDDGGPSFAALAASVSTDLRPRAVLDEWLERGLAHLDPEDRVVLRESAFVPRGDLDELAFYMGRNLGDHIAACAHNLARPEAPFFERAVYYDRLTPDSVAALRALVREKGMDLLLAVNKEALRLAERDEGRPDARERMSFGTYFFAEAEKPEGQD